MAHPKKFLVLLCSTITFLVLAIYYFRQQHPFQPGFGTSAAALSNNPVPTSHADGKVLPHSALLAQWRAMPGSPLSSTRWRLQTRCAIIIQDRPTSNLLPLILHFSMVLGTAWPIVLFTTNQTIQYYQSATLSAPFEQAVAAGLIAILPVPTAIDLKKPGDKDFLITRTWLWETLDPTQQVLIFSNDTILCSNSAQTVEDFAKWDFLGAPISTSPTDSLKIGHGGYEEVDMSGRLSLRNARLHRDIADKNDAYAWWEDSRTVGADRHEELWFADMIRRKAGKMASAEAARKWAGPGRSFGAVDLGSVSQQRAKELDDWCPEWRLALDGTTHDQP